MMLEALVASGRAAEIPAGADVYGWLAGSWDLAILHYVNDVRDRNIKGEAHFSWVLEGRAVQDVWIMKADGLVNTYGTTIRIWDPAIEAWRVTWLNPVTGRRDELIGRRHGADIVQIGRHADGTPIRWSFIEITADSFHWIGEALNPDGVTWKIEAEFRGSKRDG